MAMHVLKYRMKCLLRDRETVFWTMVFPLLLATMFHFAFGHLVGDTVSFEPVKVAVVDSPAYQNEVFLKEMLGALSAPGDGQVLDLTIADETEAQRLLSEGEVVGVITVGEDGLGSPVGGEGARSGSVRLTVAQSGLNQSILKAILDDYLHSYATVYSIVSQNPTALGGLIERLYSRSSYTRQVSYSEAVLSLCLALSTHWLRWRVCIRAFGVCEIQSMSRQICPIKGLGEALLQHTSWL